MGEPAVEPLGGSADGPTSAVHGRGTGLGGLARRIDAATPPGRDRAVDGLRALAVLGVVLGHWLVTALVMDSGELHDASPLRSLPQFTPASWLFQTLSVFFLVGGRVGAQSHMRARARGVPYRRWVGSRLARLVRPVAAVAAVWAAAVGVMLCRGAGLGTVRTLVGLVLSPLWFLLVFAALTAATPLLARVRPAVPLAVVAGADLVRFGLHGPDWIGWVNLPAGWLVPYSLGLRWARTAAAGAGAPGGGRPRVPRFPARRGAAWALLLGGVGATVLLVAAAGYPAAMVGVPGAAVSNLNPPTLAAVTFGLAQCGGALLLLGPVRRLLARPAVWAGVALLNASAMTVFLWHQTAMLAVTALGLSAGGPLPGLHTAPDGAGWVFARLAWLPVFAAALLGCWAVFRRHERPRPGDAGGARPVVVPRRTGPVDAARSGAEPAVATPSDATLSTGR